MSSGKALVLGDDTRSFLAITRSLGRRGIAVHAAPANFRSPALRSRYIGAIHDLPPWTAGDAEWLNAITELLRAQRYDLVIPCTETTLLPLQRHRARLSRFARLAVPDDRAIAVLFDKHETRELARRLGVRVAAGRLLRPGDRADRLLMEFGAPLVLKPRRSYSLENLAWRGKVLVATEATRVSQILGACPPGETIVEQYFSGQGVGVSVLCSQGRVLQAFEHHRVREIEGASFYRYSAPLTPALAEACEAIAAALAYTGLAMFEFKRGTGADWVLLEVNARPWGSMPLPVALGVDFPYRWYRLLVAGEESSAVAYRLGIYGRNLLPDLRNSLIEAEAKKLGRGAAAWFMARRMAELSRALTRGEVHDVLVRDDPRPGFIELLEIPRAVLHRAGQRMPGSAAWRRRRARSVIAALRSAPGNPLIVFVCQGNICRSPFAEALLRARLGGGRFAAASAGVMALPGRPTPACGIEAAAARGIELGAHRSRWLNRRLVDTASLLIVFDEITRSALYNRYPKVKAPVLLLGDLAGLGAIEDPIGGGLVQFTQTYGQISAAIAEMASSLHTPAY